MQGAGAGGEAKKVGEASGSAVKGGEDKKPKRQAKKHEKDQ